jgi:hypothetical protein
MTIEELEKQIASLREEVRKLKETKTAKPWRAAKGGWYYYIDSDGIVVKDLDDYSEAHLRRFQFGNYYRCKELAHLGVNELRLRGRIRQLRDTMCEGYRFTPNACNYFIFFSVVDMKYCKCWERVCQREYTVYFDTEEHAQQVCDILNAELKDTNI